MILINLLPHREAKRRARKRAFFAGLGAAAAGGLVVVGVWFSILQQMNALQLARNDFLQSEIARLEGQIKDIATLRAEIEALQARQRAVEGLQADRNTPVRLLDELVQQVPDGVYLSTIKQSERSVAVTGIAQSNERVSELLRNTAYRSTWLERPELVEIKAAGGAGTASPAAATAPREARRLFEFQMKVAIKAPPGPASPASAASAPGAPKAS